MFGVLRAQVKDMQSAFQTRDHQFVHLDVLPVELQATHLGSSGRGRMLKLRSCEEKKNKMLALKLHLPLT